MGRIRHVEDIVVAQDVDLNQMSGLRTWAYMDGEFIRRNYRLNFDFGTTEDGWDFHRGVAVRTAYAHTIRIVVQVCLVIAKVIGEEMYFTSGA